MITLFRVISRFEKQDFDTVGVLRTGPNTLEAKQFFKSVEAINEFVANAILQQYDPPYEYLLTISIDDKLFNFIAHTNVELDGYDAVNIHEDNLPAFNKCIIFVKQQAL